MKSPPWPSWGLREDVPNTCIHHIAIIVYLIGGGREILDKIEILDERKNGATSTKKIVQLLFIKGVFTPLQMGASSFLHSTPDFNIYRYIPGRGGRLMDAQVGAS